MYGWEEGLDQKMQLEAKVNIETIPGIHSLYPYQQSKHERGLLYRVLNPPPMHHWSFSAAGFAVSALSWNLTISSSKQHYIIIIIGAYAILEGKGKVYPFISPSHKGATAGHWKEKWAAWLISSKTLLQLARASAWRLWYRGFVYLFGVLWESIDLGCRSEHSIDMGMAR
jgi:hypothetical protein